MVTCIMMARPIGGEGVNRPIILLIIVLVTGLLKVFMEINTESEGGRPVLRRDQVVLWPEWCTSAMASFLVFTFTSDEAQGPVSIVAGVVIFVTSLAFLPAYVRLRGRSSAARSDYVRGIMLPNLISLCLLIAAIFLGGEPG